MLFEIRVYVWPTVFDKGQYSMEKPKFRNLLESGVLSTVNSVLQYIVLWYIQCLLVTGILLSTVV